MRHFDNFINGYMRYAVDNYCPSIFHEFTCYSIIAGALERKVWLHAPGGWHCYPNIYVFLVSAPGVGKSSAGNKGVNEILSKLPDISLIPAQVTEAEFIQKMADSAKTYTINGKAYVQSTGFFYASEASNSIKPVYGDLKPILTDFYDCPPLWSKSTRKDGTINIYNIAFSLLAGCTFEYLGKLVPEEEIMGGFASRPFYVIYEGKEERPMYWPGEKEQKSRNDLKHKLQDDLAHIHDLRGAFKADPSFQARFNEWWPQQEKRRNSEYSERMQAFQARKHVDMFKLSMIFSVAERDDLILTSDHWDKAVEKVESLEKWLPKILSLSKQRESDQAAINHYILEIMRKNGNSYHAHEFRKTLLFGGFKPVDVDNTIGMMLQNNILQIKPDRGKTYYALVGSPEDYI